MQVPKPFRVNIKEQFVEKVVAAVGDHSVLAIQFVHGFHICLTFEFVSSRHAVFHNGLSVDGINISLLEADSSVHDVYLHHCPVEVLDAVFCKVLAEFGSILDIEDCVFPVLEL